VKVSRALAPEGWHLPGYDEFEDLIRNYGLFEDKAFNMLIAGRSSGFNSLFGGWRDEAGSFHDLEVNAGYHCDANSDMNALNIRGDWKKAFIYGFPFSATGFSVGKTELQNRNKLKVIT
jgi:uncharacterized protein (TIGR02145 family)